MIRGRVLHAYYRLLPRKLEKTLHTRRKRFKWSKFEEPLKRIDANVVEIARPKIHHSVFDRIKYGGRSLFADCVAGKICGRHAGGEIRNLDSSTFEVGRKKPHGVARRRSAYGISSGSGASPISRRCSSLLSSLCCPGSRPCHPCPASGRSSIELDDGKCIGSAFCFSGGIPKSDWNIPSCFCQHLGRDRSVPIPGYLGFWPVSSFCSCIPEKGLINRIHDRMTAIWHPVAALQDKLQLAVLFPRKQCLSVQPCNCFKKHRAPNGIWLCVIRAE